MLVMVKEQRRGQCGWIRATGVCGEERETKYEIRKLRQIGHAGFGGH